MPKCQQCRLNMPQPPCFLLQWGDGRKDVIWAQDLTVGKMWYFHITFFPHFSLPSFWSPAVPTFPLSFLLDQSAGWATAGVTGILTHLPPPNTQLLGARYILSSLRFGCGPTTCLPRGKQQDFDVQVVRTQVRTGLGTANVLDPPGWQEQRRQSHRWALSESSSKSTWKAVKLPCR